MELWIRSQDKRRLEKINNGLKIFIDNRLRYTIAYEVDIDGINILGAYETEKRAIEVLDEIQNKLMKKDKNNTKLTYEIVNMANNEEKIIILKQCDLLYEMPKE